MQYIDDKTRFSELLSKFTGINENTISDYLKENTIKSLIENPTIIKVSKKQIQKLSELKELRNVTDNLKKHDKQYVLNSSNAAQDYFKEYMNNFHDKERFVCAFLDNGNRVILTKVMAAGTVNESAIYPREIVKEAILTNAKAIILAHNHPSGSLSPSQADIHVTQKIVVALSAVDIKCIDHIIVAGDQSVSFAEKGCLPDPSIVNTIREDTKKYTSIRHRLNTAKDKAVQNNNLRNEILPNRKLEQNINPER